jgi:hypothetical protein
MLGKSMEKKLTTVEVKAFVPTKDFELSKQFYTNLGFTLAWSWGDLAYFHADGSSLLLQRHCVKEHADKFMMHLPVAEVESWWRRVDGQGLGKKYGVRINPPEDRPWGMRDLRLMIRPGCCGG